MYFECVLLILQEFLFYDQKCGFSNDNAGNGQKMNSAEAKMMNILFKLFIFLMILPGSVNQSYANDNGDWQYREYSMVSKTFSPKWKLFVLHQSQFGKTETNHFLFKSLGNVSLWYIFTEQFILSLDYLQEFTREQDEWLLERRPHVNVRYRWKWIGLSFEDKNRLEFRFLEGDDFQSRFRNRLMCKKPLKVSHLLLQPYLAEEIFYDLTREGLYRNRIYTGIMLRKGVFQPELFGFWQISQENSFKENIFVVAFKMAFFF